MEKEYGPLRDFKQYLNKEEDFIRYFSNQDWKIISNINSVIAGIKLVEKVEVERSILENFIDVGIKYVHTTISKLKLYYKLFDNDIEQLNKYSLVLDTIFELEEIKGDFDYFLDEQVNIDENDLSFVDSALEHLETIINEKSDLKNDEKLYDIIMHLENLKSEYDEQLVSVSRIYELLCETILMTEE